MINEEFQRFSRQIELLGLEGQEKLKASRVAIVGVGGLGCFSALLLAYAGVGNLRLIDYDRVEISNLNRQSLYSPSDVGKLKVLSAKEKILKINPNVNIETFQEKLSKDNVKELLANCDVIIDGLDNFDTRYVVNEYAVRRKIPYMYGGINGLDGKFMPIYANTACLKCVFPYASDASVLTISPVVSLIASLQCLETIKVITGKGKLLKNKLIIFDGYNCEFIQVDVSKREDCEVCGKI